MVSFISQKYTPNIIQSQKQFVQNYVHASRGVYTPRFQTQASRAGKTTKWTGPNIAQTSQPACNE